MVHGSALIFTGSPPDCRLFATCSRIDTLKPWKRASHLRGCCDQTLLSGEITMAEKDGIFDAKMELKLTSCQSISQFGDAVELTNLRGATSIAVHVYVSGSSGPGCSPCVDLAKDCGKSARLIVLRPMSLKLVPAEPDGTGWKWSPDAAAQWVDAQKSASGISADQLATHLKFKAPGTNDKLVGLGRPQFYYDGLINLLACDAAACETVTAKQDDQPNKGSNGPIRIQFELKEGLQIGLGSDGKTLTRESKKLIAVTVQFVAAYGDCPAAM